MRYRINTTHSIAKLPRKLLGKTPAFTAVLALSSLFALSPPCFASDKTDLSESSQEIIDTELTSQKVLDYDSVDLHQLAEEAGYRIGQTFITSEFSLDLEHLIQGIRNAAEGAPPSMSDSEYEAQATAVAQHIYQKKAEENLLIANAFLAENATKEGVICLSEGKIQYRIDKPGNVSREGEKVEETSTPMLNFNAKTIDGTSISSSEEVGPLKQPMNDMLPGMAQGICGMCEGEKRTLYIHPDFAFGSTGGGLIPANTLLVMEIEIVKAHLSEEALSDQNLDQLDRDEAADTL